MQGALAFPLTDEDKAYPTVDNVLNRVFWYEN